MPFSAGSLLSSSEMLIKDTQEQPNLIKPGVHPTYCPFWDYAYLIPEKKKLAWRYKAEVKALY